MPIHHAVLALLAEGPAHGYELKTTFEEAVGPQWGGLNIGHLYQVLDRLERDELVVARRIRQTDRPDKIVYQLTDTGRQELDRWLAEPFVKEGGYRDDLFLKVFAGSRLGRGQLRRVISVQRQAYLAELAELGELRARHHEDALVALLIEAAVLHTKANLEVVDLAEKHAKALIRTAGAEQHQGGVSAGSELPAPRKSAAK
jgi:DNA-binding PadR family transcriptional regulator